MSGTKMAGQWAQVLLIAGVFCAGAVDAAGYEWTTDHMQVGVRWQPFGGRPVNNAADAIRPVIAEDSSYAQFWVSWAAMEPQEINTDYLNHACNDTLVACITVPAVKETSVRQLLHRSIRGLVTIRCALSLPPHAGQVKPSGHRISSR